MEITKVEDINTGGHCWVRYLTVTGLGDILTIGIDDEGFAGHDKPLDTVLDTAAIEIWWATNEIELIAYVGKDNASQLVNWKTTMRLMRGSTI